MSLEKFIEDFKTKSERNRKELGDYLERKIETIGTNTLEYNLDGVGFRAISAIGNLPYKLLFFSKDIGNYPRAKTQAYIANYVKDEKLEDTTIRIGHNKVSQDLYRLFKDEKLKKTPLLSRILLGIPSTLFGGLYSKLTRADYYNPFTKTAVIYSDVPAVALHELGHAKDYQNMGHPTLYSLIRHSWIGKIYQEVVASLKSHDYIKSKDKKEKTWRYLAPALATYIFA